MKAQLEEGKVQHVRSAHGAFFTLLQTGKVLARGQAASGGRLGPEVKAQLEEVGLASN